MSSAKKKPKAKPVKAKPLKKVKAKPTKKVKVAGYWVFPSSGKSGSAYYVQPYKRKAAKPGPRKKHLKFTIKPGKKSPKAPRGYVIDKHVPRGTLANRHHPKPPKGYEQVAAYRDVEPEERVAYTYKIEALVELTYKYTVSFQRMEIGAPQARGQGRTLQYYHTGFMTTVEKAKVDLHEKAVLMRAYGDIQFITVALYRVSGVGKLTDKHWKLLAVYDEPEDAIKDKST